MLELIVFCMTLSASHFVTAVSVHWGLQVLILRSHHCISVGLGFGLWHLDYFPFQPLCYRFTPEPSLSQASGVRQTTLYLIPQYFGPQRCSRATQWLQGAQNKPKSLCFTVCARCLYSYDLLRVLFVVALCCFTKYGAVYQRSNFHFFFFLFCFVKPDHLTSDNFFSYEYK